MSYWSFVYRDTTDNYRIMVYLFSSTPCYSCILTWISMKHKRLLQRKKSTPLIIDPSFYGVITLIKYYLTRDSRETFGLRTNYAIIWDNCAQLPTTKNGICYRHMTRVNIKFHHVCNRDRIFWITDKDRLSRILSFLALRILCILRALSANTQFLLSTFPSTSAHDCIFCPAITVIVWAYFK